MEEKVLIFGHKNPDTDSICSSIIMQDLENKLGRNVKAVRIGKINIELLKKNFMKVLLEEIRKVLVL